MYRLTLIAAFLLLSATSVFADALNEGFDNIATLPGNGWVLVNNSAPLGTTGWFQGNTGVFSSQAGAPDSYIAANFNNAGFGGNISNWLITPELTLTNGSVLTFFTRTEPNPLAADSLEVRLSTNGVSTDVGSTDTSVGDFTTLLLTINPLLDVNGYPSDWSQFNVTISGLGSATDGRLAFRYVVPDTSLNGDYIGIDSVVVTTPEPTTLLFLLFGAVALGSRKLFRRRKHGV